MKISYNDLMNNTSIPFKMLQQLKTERKILEERAERIQKLESMLIHLIQDKRITDTKDIDCAIAWLNHSNLEAWEIINKVLGE